MKKEIKEKRVDLGSWLERSFIIVEEEWGAYGTVRIVVIKKLLSKLHFSLEIMFIYFMCLLENINRSSIRK